jgi:hypothetical protein
MDSALSSKADIMERRLMGGGPAGLAASSQADVGRRSPGSQSSADDQSEDGMFYRRVFTPLSSSTTETTMIDFVVLQSEGEEVPADLSDDHVRRISRTFPLLR